MTERENMSRDALENLGSMILVLFQGNTPTDPALLAELMYTAIVNSVSDLNMKSDPQSLSIVCVRLTAQRARVFCMMLLQLSLCFLLKIHVSNSVTTVETFSAPSYFSKQSAIHIDLSSHLPTQKQGAADGRTNCCIARGSVLF